ncbi:MAG: hypothetical protein Pars92KO_32550 [Parasphingorhabdus sp.]
MEDKVYALTRFSKEEFDKIKKAIRHYTSEDQRLGELVGYFDRDEYITYYASPDAEFSAQTAGDFPQRTIFINSQFDSDYLDGMVANGSFTMMLAQSANYSDGDFFDEVFRTRKAQLQRQKDRLEADEIKKNEYQEKLIEIREEKRLSDFLTYSEKMDNIFQQLDDDDETARNEQAKINRQEQQQRERKRQAEEKQERDRIRAIRVETQRQLDDEREQERRRRNEEFSRTARTVNPDDGGPDGGGHGPLGVESADELIRRMTALAATDNSGIRPTCGTVPIRVFTEKGGQPLTGKLNMEIQFDQNSLNSAVHLQLG